MLWELFVKPIIPEAMLLVGMKMELGKQVPKARILLVLFLDFQLQFPLNFCLQFLWQEYSAGIAKVLQVQFYSYWHIVPTA